MGSVRLHSFENLGDLGVLCRGGDGSQTVDEVDLTDECDAFLDLGKRGR